VFLYFTNTDQCLIQVIAIISEIRASQELIKTRLEIVALDSCNQTYIDRNRPDRRMRNYIQSSQICAGVPDGENDTCQIDSGGPLQTVVDDQFYIVGVVSFRMYCGPELPSVYTRVSFYLDWIESIVWP
jgi:secreted trypsin-like serine protease